MYLSSEEFLFGTKCLLWVNSYLSSLLSDRPLSVYSVEKLDNLKTHDSSQEPFSSEVLSIYHV